MRIKMKLRIYSLLYSCSKFLLHYAMLCFHQCQRGILLEQLINFVLSLMLQKMSYHYQSVYVELTQALKTIFYGYLAFLILFCSGDSFYRVHSGIEDNFLCLPSILEFAQFKRQCLLSSLRCQRKVCYQKKVLTSNFC